MNFEKRQALLTELGVGPEALPKIKSYIDLLWAANEELNLISRKMTFDELIDNHLVDCLLPLAKFPTDLKCVADFGSGGGLPGVVYAIQFPNLSYRLYEKSPKKREFLTRCKAVAPNLEIHGEIPKDLPNVDLVTARAFKPVDVIMEMSREYYKRGGRYFLLKGRREKIEEEITLARKKFKDIKPEIIPLKSPVMDVERNLVLI